MKRSMKKMRINSVICVMLTLALVFFNFAGLDLGKVEAHAGQQLNGDGTEESPYEISDYNMLKQFSDIVNGKNGYTSNRGACAILTNDIVCTDELWNPIGDSVYYSGHFDGRGYKIIGLSNAKVNGIKEKDYQGLFGQNNGEVKNVGLQGTNILGKFDIGGVAGFNNGSITNSYNIGVVSGQNYVGGVAGFSSGIINESYNTGAVSGQNYIGGVVGGNAGSITSSYNTGAVSGQNYVGGVVGRNDGSITNSYNTGAVSGQIYIGGVIGLNGGINDTVTEFGIITNSYNTGEVSGQNEVGGVAGSNIGSITNCYYDKSICKLERAIGANYVNDSENVKGLETSYMTGTELKDEFTSEGENNPWLYRANDENNYFYPHLNGVNFETINVDNNSGANVAVKYWPARRLSGNANVGTGSNPYEISDYNILKQFSDIVNGENGYTSNTAACAILTNDIVCTDKEWVPIGGAYTGTFDGQFHKIVGLNNSEITDIDTMDRQGLFGLIKYGGAVKNLGLENSYIRGSNYVGGIAGENIGTITNCYNVGVVCGRNECIGGLVGWNNSESADDAEITNCYCIGNVSGKSNIGGLVGLNYFTTSLEYCYFVGDISAQSNAGGAVGYNMGRILECYSAGWTPVGFSDEYGSSIENKVKELTVKQMTGTTATSKDNMFSGNTSPWLVKEDAEYNGKYYWFYPHLAGFDKDASGNQLAAADITADKWLGKAEISVTWNGADSYEYDKSVHATDVTKVVLKTDSTANGKEAEYTDYTVSYSQITGKNDNGQPVWTDVTDKTNIVNAGTYKTVLGFGTGHKAIEKQYSITEKAVTVTPDDVTKVYGTTDPELAYTASGLIDGDALSGALTRTAGEAVGEYEIALGSLSNPNYDITLASGKKLTIASKVLGKDELVLSSYEYTYDGTVKVPVVKVYDGDKEVDPTLYDVEILNNVNAGTAIVNVKEKSAANFVGTTTFTINKAEAIVIADNKQKAYGEADPGLTYTITGLYGTDTLGADQIIVSRKDGENVRTYEISVSGKDDIGNYTVKYVPGLLTIVKADPVYTVPSGLTATVGQKLSEVELPKGWAWADKEQLVGEKGTKKFKATYTPEDTENYNEVSDIELSIVVGKADPAYTVPSGLTATVGQKLSEVKLPDGWAWVNGEQLVGEKGTNKFTANYTPEDTANYNVVSNIELSIVVSEPEQNNNNGSGSNTGTSGSDNGGSNTGTSGSDNGGSSAGNSGSGSSETGTSTSTDSSTGDSGYTGSGNGGSGTASGTGNGGSSNTGSGTTSGTGNIGSGTKSGSGAATSGSGAATGSGSGASTGSESATGSGSGTSTGDVTEPEIIKNDDGSESVTTVTTNENGEKVSDTVTTFTDGTTEESTLVEKSNGSKIETVVTKDKDDNVIGEREVTTTKKGTVTVKETTVDSDGNTTVTERKHKKNGSGSSKSETKDENGNILSTTTEKTTVSKKVKSTVATTTLTTENADKTTVKTEIVTVTDKKGNSTYNETTKNPDKTKKVVEGKSNADGTGTATTIVTNKKGKVLSKTEETTEISAKGTITVSSTTTNADGTSSSNKISTSKSGEVTKTDTFTDKDGKKTTVKETIKPGKKGSTKVSITRTETIGKGKKKQSSKVTVNVSVSKKGIIKGSITVPGADGVTQKTDVKTSLKELGLEGKDISEVIEYLLQNIIVKK